MMKANMCINANLCGFATARLSTQDHHIILQQGLHDLLFHASDGQASTHCLNVTPPLHMNHTHWPMVQRGCSPDQVLACAIAC